MTYKLYKTLNGTDAAMKIDGETTTSFLFDTRNPDYQAYLKWLEEGNTPEPADQA